MSERLSDRTGVSPAVANTAVIVLDMISDFEFEDGDRLRANALQITEALAALTERARSTGVPVIFVNDNFGRWTENFATHVDHVKQASEDGRHLIERIGPKPGDYHILKPQRSAFYATPLEVLLLTLEIKHLVLTGITTDICVLFTAHDAYMRGYRITVPSDCTAAVKDEYHLNALRFLERVVHAQVTEATAIGFSESAERGKQAGGSN